MLCVLPLSLFITLCVLTNSLCPALQNRVASISQDLQSKHALSPAIAQGNGLQGEWRPPFQVPHLTRGAAVLQVAMAGNTQAQHSVGLLYHMGYGGLSKSDTLSTCWHAIAAAQGHHDSLAVLGGCLRKGSSIDRDVSLAMDCIQAAAAEGSAYGYVKLGAIAEEEEDYSSAYSYYKEACDSPQTPKSALALFSLGWAFMEFPIDMKDMAKKKRKAEAQQCWKQSIALAPFDGSDEAAYHLGMYLGGLWHPSGKKYLELAAQLGNEEARKEFKSQVNILESYFDGEYEER